MLVRPAAPARGTAQLHRNHGRLRRQPPGDRTHFRASYDVVSFGPWGVLDEFQYCTLNDSKHPMCNREPGHTTTKDSGTPLNLPPDTSYHITALASTDMTTGRFRAFATHIYVRGRIPYAKYWGFSSTFAVLRRGTREKKVIDESVPLPPEFLSQVH